MRAAVLLLLALLPRSLDAQALAPCAPDGVPGVECGTIEVFEDRAAGAGRTLTITFVVLRADSASGREPLFMFSGGPGDGSTGLARRAHTVFRPVRLSRDIVLVDQRGTGRSNPLRCPTDVATRPAGAFGAVFDPAVFRTCRARLSGHADLALYTTDLAVQDVDDVRKALGYDKVLLWGGSYGTRFAQAYLRKYPDRVTAAVLDGVVPFDFDAPSGYARSLQQALDRVLADCRAFAACHDSFPALERDWARVLGLVGNGPAPARVTDGDGRAFPVRMSAGDLSYAVRGILYRADGARALPGIIHRAATAGDPSELAQRYWQRAADFGDFADGLHLSVLCAEDTRFIRDDQVRALVRGTFMGDYLIEDYRNACAEWVVAPVNRAEIVKPVTADVPVLLVSGWFDPATPPETGAAVAAKLPRARHLVVRNGAHGAGNGCAWPAVLSVLIRGALEGLPAVCEDVRSLWNDDPFARLPAGTGARLVADLKLGRPGAAAALRSRLVTPGIDTTVRRTGWSGLCADAFRRAVWRAGIEACEKAGDQATLALIRALSDRAPPSIEGTGAQVALDSTGRARVSVGDGEVPGIMDTGAEISVMMASVARAAGVRFAGEAPKVETSTAPVSARAGTVPVVRIGQVTLRDLPVIVLPDSQLIFDEGRVRLDFIVGLHAFLPLGRMAWLDRGRILALGDQAPALDGPGAPLFWHNSGFGVAVTGPGGRRPAHWDTGANRTSFYPSGIFLLAGEEAAARRPIERRTGGVGGIRVEQGWQLPRAAVSIDGVGLVLENTDVSAEDDDGDAMRLGLDIVHRVETIIVDFERMRMRVRQ